MMHGARWVWKGIGGYCMLSISRHKVLPTPRKRGMERMVYSRRDHGGSCAIVGRSSQISCRSRSAP